MNWKPHKLLEPPTDEEIAVMDPEELVAIHKDYHDAIDNAAKDPYRYGFELPHWKYADDLLENFRTILLLGANRCLAGEQEIYDPVKKKSIRVDSITEGFHVYAWDFDKRKRVIARAEKPYTKRPDSLYEVHLSNGERFSCSAEHRVLTSSGWCGIAEVGIGGLISQYRNTDSSFRSFCGSRIGCSESLPYSSSGSVPSTWREDVLRLSQTVQDFLSDCPSSRRFYDEQLHSSLGGVQGGFLKQDDAQEHRAYVSCDEDGRARRQGDSRLYQQSRRPSSPYACFRFLGRCAGTLCRVLSKALIEPEKKISSPYFSINRLQLIAGYLRFQFSLGVRRCLLGILGVVSSSLTLSGECRLVKVYRKRRDVVWDISVPEYGNYFIGNVLQKNSGKTSYSARKIVQSALKNPNGLIFCFAQTHEISVLVQQRAVWEALPAEYRVKKVNDGSISYTYKNGFSDKKMILPNKTQIVFKTYTQYQQDDTILEGMELGSPEPTVVNIGCWLDEYLLGMEMVDRIMLRLATHNAKLIISFTPKDGETETVRYYRNTATTVEHKHVSEGLSKPQTVPYVQHNKKMSTGISYFHSKDNPWSGYESLLEQCVAKGDDDYTLTALYGVPTQMLATKFPRFNPDVNVLPHDEILERIKTSTKYMIVDPAGSKPWFMTWIAVDPTDTWYVYREWPNINHGAWGEEKNGKWMQGEACKQKLGYGVKDYVDLIRELEQGEEIMTRLIDPRMGATKYSAENGGQSDYITDLEAHNIITIPAPGIEEEPGLQTIQDKLAYNPQKPIDASNRPRFYISDECENNIRGLQFYDGKTRDHPWKDPVDTLRYGGVYGLDYIDLNKMKVTRQGRGGY